ncbi:MAG: heme-binding protein [Pseudomonadota bacterium]
MSVARCKIIGAIMALTFLCAKAMAYEEPRYTVIATYDDFELRQYEPYLVAETTVDGDFQASGNTAFRLLAGYIFGNNEPAEKMAMTVPVTRRDGPGEKMAMTSPVTRQTGPLATTYQFVMEDKYTLDTLPAPLDPRVTLKTVPGRMVAVRRYRGRINERNYQKNLTILQKALGDSGLTPLGAPLSAVYNGPFTPPFLRRNEVLIDIEPTSVAAGGDSTTATTASHTP